MMKFPRKSVFDTPSKRKKGFPKPALALILLSIILALTLIFFPNREAFYKGRVETTLYPVVAQASGILVESPVSVGMPVKQGDVIGRIDDSDLQYQVDQQTLALEKVRLQLQESTLSNGSHASNALTSAQAAYNAASSAKSKAESDYQDMGKLYEEGAIAKEDLEKSSLSLDQARSASSIALSGLQNALNQSGSSLLATDLMLAESQLLQAKEKLDKTLLLSPTTGIIVTKSYQAGNLIALGYQLVEVGDTENLTVLFFVSEKRLNEFPFGSKIKISSNAQEVEGRVIFVDLKSQFTPREYQTASNRNKTSFLIKASLPPGSDFTPGEQVTVRTLSSEE